MTNVEEQWQQFMSEDIDINDINKMEMFSQEDKKINLKKKIPKCTSLKISTKSKIIYLNRTFDLTKLFWQIKTIDYDDEKEGIIKKQIKFNFINKDDVKYFEKMIVKEHNVKLKILNQIDNPNGRVKFKDVRKVDVGYCKNDILKPNKESKSAFYNCFVIIFRMKYNGKFNEFHVKLFNSGKVEVPGIQSENMLNSIINILIKHLQPLFQETIQEIDGKREIVLVNSNFKCNYYLNREKLVKILKSKYKIKCGMDSCSYPGIQCKYKLERGIEISFMIFRTGSVLIVGKCNDEELYHIYNFLQNIFKEEYYNICEEESELEKIEKKKNNKGNKKPLKTITILKNKNN
jgi:TATA-box binding protein (TBP) (component of TFIID and TFIIIB)